jgi:uncharacterized protein (TIGR02594 family)
MRHQTRILLAIGCVGLLALSIPAFSLPSPRGLDADQRAKATRAAQQKKDGKRAPAQSKTKPVARSPAPTPANRPPAGTEHSQRAAATSKPMFGWPALVSEARKYLGTNPTARKRLWCATFMNLVLAKLGYAGTNSDAAKSFADYGRRISEPKVGAIAVLTRGKRGGHVGVVTGIDSQGNPIIISGNHGHRVGEAAYSRARVIAYVMPTDRRPVNTQVTDRGAPSRPASEPDLESPITELLAAIEAEQSRAERPRQRAAPAQPAVPHRVVQQMPQQAPQPPSARHSLPLDPALAELLGIKDRAQQAAPPRPAPQRQQRVQQQPPGRVAAADAGLAGVRTLR